MSWRTLLPSGTKVHENKIASTDWQELDLSAVVGRRDSLVYLRVKAQNGGRLIVKPRGAIGAWGVAGYWSGCSNLNFEHSGNKVAYLITATDSQGKIDIWAEDAEVIYEIWVAGFIN